MDTVLGLSVTPTTVGLVLVEGQDGDGATVDRDAFEVRSHGLANAVDTSEQAAAAIRRTEAVASIRGHRLHSIGVTWSDDADTEASLLVKSLADAGFDNVVPVQLPEATEALAYGMADAMGYETTAVCVVEPETVVMLVVHREDGAIQTAVNSQIDTDEGLIHWVSAVFTQADWQPRALVLVGSAGDIDTILPQLEEMLSVPVFAPAEAQLALARGAALASAHETEAALADGAQAGYTTGHARQPSRLAPVAMLAAGLVTFVVSVSLAIGLHVTPKKAPPPAAAEAKPAADLSPIAPTLQAVPPVPPPPPEAPAPPSVDPPLAPSPEVVPVESAPPVQMPVEPSSGVVETPAEASEAVPAAPPIDAVPGAPQMGAAPAAPPGDAAAAGPPLDGAPAAPPGAAPAPPGAPPQPGAAPMAPAEPTSKPPLLTRVLSKIPGLHGSSDDDEPEQAPAQMAPQQAPAPPPAGPAPPPAAPPPPPPPGP